MPSCAFLKCTNTTKNTNKCSGVTFHSFPQDPYDKEKWIKIIQEDQRDDEWLPSRHSRICSAHFKDTDLCLTKLGRRKVKAHAMPAFRPNSELSPDLNEENKNGTAIVSSLNDIDVSDTDSVFDSPITIHLKKKLAIEKKKKEKYRKLIVKLKRQNKNFRARTHSLKELVRSLKLKQKILMKKLKQQEGSKSIIQIAVEASGIKSPNST